MTVQQWFAMQPESDLKGLVEHVPFSLAYGCVKAYQLLPEQARQIIQKAFESQQKAFS